MNDNYAEKYITKATAQEVVKDVFRVDTITQEVIDTCMKCMTAIKNAPTADVRENVKGHWVVDRYCSVCDFDKYEADCCCGGLPQNFCPNCGADMRDETND